MEVLYKPTWSLWSRTAQYDLYMGFMNRTGPRPATGFHDLVRGGSLSFERFSATLEQVLAAVDHTDLEAVILAQPPFLVRLTPLAPVGPTARTASRRRSDVRVLAGSWLQPQTLGLLSERPGRSHRRQLGRQSNQPSPGDPGGRSGGYRPRRCGRADGRRSGRAQLESLAPGRPVWRISTLGPTGVIHIRHPNKRMAGPITHRRRRHASGRPSWRR